MDPIYSPPTYQRLVAFCVACLFRITAVQLVAASEVILEAGWHGVRARPVHKVLESGHSVAAVAHRERQLHATVDRNHVTIVDADGSFAVFIRVIDFHNAGLAIICQRMKYVRCGRVPKQEWWPSLGATSIETMEALVTSQFRCPSSLCDVIRSHGYLSGPLFFQGLGKRAGTPGRGSENKRIKILRSDHTQVLILLYAA